MTYRFLSTFISLSVLLVLTGCDTELENDVSELVENKNKWIAKIQEYDYTYSFKIVVNRQPAGNSATELYVEKGKLAQARNSNGEYISISKPRIKTMKDVFNHIFSLIKQKEQNKNMIYYIEYDDSFGYPKEISLKRTNVMDGDGHVKISNVALGKQ